MRFLFYLLPLLLFCAGAAGCGSKAPAGSNPPPGLTKNPICPDPEAIKSRKLTLIDPRKAGDPSRAESKH